MPEREEQADHVGDREAAARRTAAAAARRGRGRGRGRRTPAPAAPRRPASRGPPARSSRRRCRARCPRCRGTPRRRAAAVPRRSSRCQAPFDSRDREQQQRQRRPAATGTLSQKIACQLTPSTTAPPMTGPSATPRPETPPQMPIAAARIAGGHRRGEQGQRQRHDRGGAEALDRAGRDQRLRRRCSAPRRSRRAVKSVMPASITRRRPSRSPSVAAGSMKVANASV